MDSSQALSTLIEIGSEEHRLDPPRKWKAQGKKVVGWTCAYIPEEIIYAAGMLPFRTFGSVKEQPVAAEAYLPTNSCSYCLSCLDLAARKEYDFLDGIVASNGCDDMRRLYDNWVHFIEKPDFKFLLDVPHKDNIPAQKMFTNRVIELKQGLEKLSGSVITDDALRDAIKVFNKTRSLLGKLYELRKRDVPPISGADTMAVVIAGMSMPKPEFNALLESALVDLEAAEPPSDAAILPRILVTGPVLANPEEIQLIEESGAWVVADDLCTGMRYFHIDVDPDTDDPVQAIARRYLTRIPCARMLSHKGRHRGSDVTCLESCPGYGQDPECVLHDRKLLHDVQMIKDFRVDGVIYTSLKFCSPWLYTLPAYMDDLEKLTGTPLLTLQREYAATGMGQMSTRVGAFLEMIE